MRLLAIETASPPGSMALLDDQQVVCAADLDHPRRTTQQFASLLQQLLDQAHWSARDVQCVATTIGPGSFTGLRIGITTAKVFAYAANAPTVGVNTLEVIAHQCPTQDRPIEVVLDAQRQQLFVARFEFQQDTLCCVEPTHIVDADAWIDRQTGEAVLTGTGLQRYESRLYSYPLADKPSWVPRATTLGLLAHAAAARGETTPPTQLTPQYFRRSAAEEKLETENA